LELLMVGGGAMGFFMAANDIHIMRQTILALPTALKSYFPAANTLRVLEKALAHLSTGDQEAAANSVRKASMSKKSAQAVDPSVLVHMAESVRLAGIPGMVADEFVRMSDTDLQSCVAETNQVSRAVCNVGHIMVALGVLVSLLGIIHAGYITDHAEYMIILSHALVGAFLGVLIGWGFVLAVGHRIKARNTLLQMQYRCINLALGAHLRGLPPALALEAGRMALSPALRPSRVDEVADDGN
jgi:chemotaxis protein MotA